MRGKLSAMNDGKRLDGATIVLWARGRYVNFGISISTIPFPGRAFIDARLGHLQWQNQRYRRRRLVGIWVIIWSFGMYNIHS